MKNHNLISGRAYELAESPTLALLEKVEALEAQDRRVIGFHIGEPDFGIPPNVAQAIKDAVDQGKTTYTHQAGIHELREALSSYYRDQFGLNYDAEHIVVTAGPKDTIFKAMGTVVNPGDRIVVFDPHWEAYGEQVRFFHGRPTYVPRDRDNLSYRLDCLEDAFKQGPKVLIFTNPDNPTGYRAGEEELRAIAELARRHNVAIFSDEIYWLHCYDGASESIARFYPEGTVILSGASKAWAGTGLRVGFALFPEGFGDVAEHMARVTGQASSSVNAPAQWGIVEALTNPETRAWEREMVAEFRRRRDLTQAQIGHLLGYELGGAFYAAPRTPIHGDVFSERLLQEEYVCVLPMSTLSSGPHGYFDDRVRLAYVTDMGTLEEGLARFRRFTERQGA